MESHNDIESGGWDSNKLPNTEEGNCVCRKGQKSITTLKAEGRRALTYLTVEEVKKVERIVQKSITTSKAEGRDCTNFPIS